MAHLKGENQGVRVYITYMKNVYQGIKFKGQHHKLKLSNIDEGAEFTGQHH